MNFASTMMSIKKPTVIACLLVMALLKTAAHPSATMTDSMQARSKHKSESIRISAESVKEKLKAKERLFLVDIRPRKAFEKVSVPGSINIPLHMVRNKPFLKSSPLVLIDRGYGYKKIEKTCIHLKKAGFTVSIMHGGLNAWMKVKGPLQGDLLALRGSDEISTLTFFQEKNNPHLLAIDTGGVRTTGSKGLIPNAIHMPILEDPEGSLIRLKKTVARQKQNPFLTVIIANESGDGYRKFHKIVGEAGLINVFYLHGGLEGYKLFLKNLVLSRQPVENRIKSVGACHSCEKENDT